MQAESKKGLMQADLRHQAFNNHCLKCFCKLHKILVMCYVNDTLCASCLPLMNVGLSGKVNAGSDWDSYASGL
jgi:hypothetical protein